MTFEEIARVLGVMTPAEVAAATGLPLEAIRPVMSAPMLVLDYRGGEGARRWDRLARPPIPALKKKLGLDPRTGLKVEKEKKVRRKVQVPLTDVEWHRVFELRCRSKRGEHLSPEDRALCDRTFEEDLKRYSDLEPLVFNATVPFGSAAKYRSRKGSLS